MSEMGTDVKVVVSYTLSNIERCMCPQCPVQAGSVCVQEGIGNLKNEMKSSGEGAAPEPQKVPGVYCSAGSAACRDLNPVSYTHLRAHETVLDLVCRLLLDKKKK